MEGAGLPQQWSANLLQFFLFHREQAMLRSSVLFLPKFVMTHITAHTVAVPAINFSQIFWPMIKDTALLYLVMRNGGFSALEIGCLRTHQCSIMRVYVDIFTSITMTIICFNQFYQTFLRMYRTGNSSLECSRPPFLNYVFKQGKSLLFVLF